MEDNPNFQGALTYIVYSHPDLRVKTTFILEYMIHCNQEERPEFWDRPYL